MATTDRRKREIQRTREDIFEAAARAFARSGYSRVTMQEIAREAGYTAASLYTYFRSKEEILSGLRDAVTAEYARTFDQGLPDGLTFVQKFELVLRRQLELADRRRSMFVGLFAVDEGFGRQFRDSFEKRIRHIAQWLRHNATREDLGGHTPDVAARFLFGFVFAFAHHWLAVGSKERLGDRIPVIARLFFHGIGKSTP